MSDVKGQWTIVGRSGVVGIHAALLHTNQVLFFARPERPSHKYGKLTNGLLGDETHSPNDQDITLSCVMEISGPDAFIPYPVQVEHNPFCSGHTFLEDGRLFIAGGDKKHFPVFKTDPRTPEATKSDGRNSLRTFTPGTINSANQGLWKHIGEMGDARWYPTCALLPDGRVFIVSGYLDDKEAFNNQNPTCEIFPPLPSGPQYLPFLVDAWPYDSYPFVFTLPTGSIFVFAKDRAYNLNLIVDKFGRERWLVTNGAKLPAKENSEEEPAKQYPNSATAVLLPLLPENAYEAEVLLVGGGGLNVHTQWDNVPGSTPPLQTRDVQASNSCFKLKVDPFNSTLEWQRQSSMTYSRVMPDAVLLPDGTVLVVNGVMKGFGGGDPATGPTLPQNAVKDPELYDPQDNTWHTLAKANFTRLYHSTALLLPDGTVMIAGSDHQVSIYEAGDSISNRADSYEYQMELFEPPYLFNGTERASRPVINNVQDRVAYRQQFEIEVADLSNMKEEDLQVALLRPGSVTHGNNMSQRHIKLVINSCTSTHIAVVAPPNSNVAPPSFYMLFLLHRGVPSVARFIQLVQPSNGNEFTFPSSIDMALWLKGDEGVSSDNGNVSSWSDCSDRRNDVFLKENLGINAIQRPPRLVQNELNGHSVVRFSLFSNAEATSTTYGGCLESKNQTFLSGSGPYSVFVVTHPWPPSFSVSIYNNSVGWGDLIGWGDYTTPNSDAFVGLRFGPGPRLQNISALPKIPGTASINNYWNINSQGMMSGQFGDQDNDPLVSLSSAFLIEMFYDGVYTGIRINGHEIKKSLASTEGRKTGNGPLTIGLNGGSPLGLNDARGAYFRGDIAEVLIYEQSITGARRYDIQEYLRNKYALW